MMGLYRVRPDCLKIDRRIVAATADEHTGSGAHAVLKAIVEIGKALKTDSAASLIAMATGFWCRRMVSVHRWTMIWVIRDGLGRITSMIEHRSE